MIKMQSQRVGLPAIVFIGNIFLHWIYDKKRGIYFRFIDNFLILRTNIK